MPGVCARLHMLCAPCLVRALQRLVFRCLWHSSLSYLHHACKGHGGVLCVASRGGRCALLLTERSWLTLHCTWLFAAFLRHRLEEFTVLHHGALLAHALQSQEEARAPIRSVALREAHNPGGTTSNA